MSIWIQVDNKEHVASGIYNATKSPRALSIMMKPWIKPFFVYSAAPYIFKAIAIFPGSNDFKGFTLYCLSIYSNCNEFSHCMNEWTIYSISTIQLTNSNTIAIVCRVTEINVCILFGRPEVR